MSYVKKKSQKQEKRTAKDFGGKTVIASGALWTSKGDVRTDNFLIENKFTDKGYYSLKLSIWEKITKEAIKDNCRIPLMQIDIQDLSLVVIANNDFKGLEHHRDILVTSSMSTTKKSSRLVKEEIEEMLQYSDGILHHFKVDDEDKYLVILKKDTFKEII